MVYLGIWFTQEYSCSIIKFDCKKNWHTGLIWGKSMVKTKKMYLEYACLRTKYGGVYFTWCMSLCDMSYWWAHSTYILLYYITPGMAPAGIHSTSSFQITMTIDWYARIGCGMGRSHFRILKPNWHVVGVRWGTSTARGSWGSVT